MCSCKTEISIGGITKVPRNFLLERQLQDELRKLEAQRISNESCSLCYDNIQVRALTNLNKIDEKIYGQILSNCRQSVIAPIVRRTSARFALKLINDNDRPQSMR